MFNLASKLIESIVSTISSTRQQHLDSFITSRRPSTPAEVENLIREYDRKQSTTGWIL